jgi:hypothetical protein
MTIRTKATTSDSCREIGDPVMLDLQKHSVMLSEASDAVAFLSREMSFLRGN